MARTMIYYCDICGKELTNEENARLSVEIVSTEPSPQRQVLFHSSELCMDCFEVAHAQIKSLAIFLGEVGNWKDLPEVDKND